MARDALSAGVEGALAVDEEMVLMMAVMHLDLGDPGAVGLFAHGDGARIPIVEFTGKENFASGGGDANEIDRLGHFLGRVTVNRTWGVRLRREHWYDFNLHLFAAS
jgi:hypothetical protein